MSIFKLKGAAQCARDAADPASEETPALYSVLLSDEPGKESEIVSGDSAGTLLGAWLKDGHEKELGENAGGILPYSIVEYSTPAGSELQLFESRSGKALLIVADAAPDAKIWFSPQSEYDADSLERLLDDGAWKENFQAETAQAGDLFDIEENTAFVTENGITLLYFKEAPDAAFTALEDDHDHHDHDHDHEEDDGLFRLDDGQGEWGSAFDSGLFAVDLFNVDGALTVHADERSFLALVFLKGSAVIDVDDYTLHAAPLDTVFASANEQEFKITGNCTLAAVYLSGKVIHEE